MLVNKTTNKTIIKDIRVASNFFAKLKGLMFERKERFNYALIMVLKNETRIGASIHMLFVFFPIAVFFLDAKKRIVDKTLLKPFSLNYTPKRACKYIVELPANRFTAAKIGDVLQW